MNKLHKYSRLKRIGNKAADTLKSILEEFALVNIHDESIDLSIYMRAQIIKCGVPH